MKKKRLLSKVLALTLSLALLCGIALAENWDLANGSITIDTSNEAQWVSQGDIRQEDSTPVIIQNSSQTSNTVTITGGGTANVTIRDITSTASGGSAIDIQGNTNANIQAEGQNSLTTLDQNSAAIHVSQGNLNLNVQENGSLEAKNNSMNGYGAGIGSDRGEDLSGNIHISGKGSVTAGSNGGAGIGSGSEGHVTGGIITGEGDVNAAGNYGAGIGSGSNGNVTGSITTGDGNVVSGSAWGAGIGSGSAGDMKASGSITTGKGNVTAASEDGAGMGSGFNGHMNGSITTGEGQVAAHSTSGAGMGSGSNGKMGGSITTGDGNVTSGSSFGAGMGSGVSGDMTDAGSITTGKGAVNPSSSSGAGIGSGFGGEMNGKVNIPVGGQVTSTSKSAAPIGSGMTGSVGHKAQLNVKTGVTINGKEVESIEDAYGLGIPDDQVHELTESMPAPAEASRQLPKDLYWILSEGASIRAQEALDGTVLTLTVEEENASLHITGFGLNQLEAQGIRTIVFKTASLESRFALADVLGTSNLVLNHLASAAELTLDGEASDLLK